MIATLKPLIKSLLETITTLDVVYDYHNATPESYPCASFEIARIGNEEYDTCNNTVTYDFDIIIQQTVNTLTTHSIARGILDDTIDEIVETVNENTSLSGTCLRSLISNIDFAHIIHDKGEILSALIQYRCVTTDFIR